MWSHISDGTAPGLITTDELQGLTLDGCHTYVAQPVCQPCCLTWSDFPTGGAAPGLSFAMSCHVYPDIMLGNMPYM
jgi:hypothetical protein